MRRALLAIFLTAAAASSARAADPADPAKAYRIETEGTTRKLEVGATGKLVLAIVPLQGAHVHPAAPLKIALGGSAGLKLSREQLGHADAVDPKAEGPRFEVPFTALAAGAQEARARLDFYLCSEAWCVKQARDVSVSVDVK